MASEFIIITAKAICVRLGILREPYQSNHGSKAKRRASESGEREAPVEKKRKKRAFSLPPRLDIFDSDASNVTEPIVKIVEEHNAAYSHNHPKSSGVLVLTWVSGIMGLSSGDVLYRVERGVARMRGLGRTRPVR